MVGGWSSRGVRKVGLRQTSEQLEYSCSIRAEFQPQTDRICTSSSPSACSSPTASACAGCTRSRRSCQWHIALVPFVYAERVQT